MKKIYIGPTIDGVAIRHTVYEELPEPLAAAIKKTPYLSGLCVPVSELASAMKQMNSRSWTIYQLYTKALKDRVEITKGAN